MASTPTSSPLKGGKFSQKALLITVGPKRHPFYVHVPKLRETSFFDHHGEPPTDEEKQRRATAQTPTTENIEDIIKTENTVEGLVGDQQKIDIEGPDALEVDYHLEDRFVYTPPAFEVLVHWIYNRPPETPRTRGQCSVLLKAYYLAFIYNINPLQDYLIDRFREWHKGHHVTFEDLLWMVGRLGDNPEGLSVPMIQYLIDQIAYEVMAQGFEVFSQNNFIFQNFLTTGSRQVRALLVKAIVRYGRGQLEDPAFTAHQWKIEDRVIPEDVQAEVVDLD